MRRFLNYSRILSTGAPAPGCTVTVYLTGTQTLASIFSDDLRTPKSNPFTADADGLFYFYADDGRYDVRFSGTGIATPYTWGDQVLGADGIAGTTFQLHGTASLVGGVAAVAFDNALPSASFQVLITGSAQAMYWVTDKTVNGFTINSSENAGIVDWLVVRAA